MDGGWVLITVLGWLSFIVGLIRIIFPVQLAEFITKAGPAMTGALPVFGVVFLLVGGFLSFKAYGPG